jgi:hypothetical protein
MDDIDLCTYEVWSDFVVTQLAYCRKLVAGLFALTVILSFHICHTISRAIQKQKEYEAMSRPRTEIEVSFVQ